jgi:DeoR family transcriptional regulator of aga operon/DeoR family fructose operon transcriptional repressor
MIQAERIRQISEIAAKEEIITLDALTEILGVSKATIRRDIDELTALGIVEKTRGGAVFIGSSPEQDPVYATRLRVHTEEKKRIAKAAAEYIEEGSNLMFDSGSTILELAKMLPKKKHLNISTYDLRVAEALMKKDFVDLLMIGGLFRRRYYSFHGYFAERMIREIYSNMAFLGADALDTERGIMGHNTYDVRLKQWIMENTQKAILLCDHSKFGGSAFIHIADWTKIALVITGKETEDTYVQALEEKNIAVQLV